MNDIDNPLEKIKVEQALRSEMMKLEYRKKNKPKEINILDYTVIAALEKQIPKSPKGLSITFEGKVGNCPSCNKLVRESDEKPNICNCGQRLEW